MHSPVHVTKFSSDKVHILSASDDKTVRYWSLTSDRPEVVITGAHRVCPPACQPPAFVLCSMPHSRAPVLDSRTTFGVLVTRPQTQMYVAFPWLNRSERAVLAGMG